MSSPEAPRLIHRNTTSISRSAFRAEGADLIPHRCATVFRRAHSFPFPGRPPPSLQRPSSAEAACSGCSPAWGASACSRRAPAASGAARWPCRQRCPVPRCHCRTPPSPLRRRGPGSSVCSPHSQHCGRGGGDGQWRVETWEGRHRRDFYGGGGGEVRHVMEAAMQ